MKQPLLDNKEISLEKYFDELKKFNSNYKYSFIIVGIFATIIGIVLYNYWEALLEETFLGIRLGPALAILFGVFFLVLSIYVVQRRQRLSGDYLEKIGIIYDAAKKQNIVEQNIVARIEEKIQETKDNNKPKTETPTVASGLQDGSSVDINETTGGMTQDIKNNLYKSIKEEAFGLYLKDNDDDKKKAILMLNYIVGHKFFRGCPMITYSDFLSYRNPIEIKKTLLENIKKIEDIDIRLQKLTKLLEEVENFNKDDSLLTHEFTGEEESLLSEINTEIKSIEIEGRVNKALKALDNLKEDKINFLEGMLGLLNEEKEKINESMFEKLINQIEEAKNDIRTQQSGVQGPQYPPASGFETGTPKTDKGAGVHRVEGPVGPEGTAPPSPK